MTEQAPAVKVAGLRKTYAGGFAAVDGLDVEIPAPLAVVVVWALALALSVWSAAIFAGGRLKP